MKLTTRRASEEMETDWCAARAAFATFVPILAFPLFLLELFLFVFLLFQTQKEVVPVVIVQEVQTLQRR